VECVTCQATKEEAETVTQQRAKERPWIVFCVTGTDEETKRTISRIEHWMAENGFVRTEINLWKKEFAYALKLIMSARDNEEAKAKLKHLGGLVEETP
jgi:serine protease inhibitor ecotin